ncbi:hypothetical protein BCR34DRAFT_565744 [Clohesyomyces aquaticus]|uniref:F-box domain-containing protein n=1 Tax=Clohesyomyces aquaticus TaxID=1231657 RepID=A0A1Y1ZLJ7_9PLEO|nr:hypothetical protein BCR34DRAFT_565744 [Clohesyomyces aquaticus]
MAGILDLPQELHDAILDLLSRDSLVPFVLTCRHVYVRSSRAISRHNAYTAMWKTTTLTRFSMPDVLKLCHQVSRNHCIGEYVQNLDFDKENFENDPNIWRPGPTEDEHLLNFFQEKCSPWLLSVDRPGFDRLRRFVFQSPCWGLNWMPAIVLALLVTLPRLLRLTLPPLRCRPSVMHTDEALLVELLTLIVHEARLPTIPKFSITSEFERRPLAELKTLHLFPDAIFARRASLAIIVPFMSLPTLNEIYATNRVGLYRQDGDCLHWPFATIHAPSTLRRLELAWCTCDPQVFEDLLSYTPQLEIFKYSHRDNSGAIGNDWDAGRCITAIARHVRHTLHTLCLTFAEVSSIWSMVDGSPRDLRQLQALHKLEMDSRIFADVAFRWHWGDPVLDEGEVVEQRIDVVERFVDVLPRNIKKITINLNGRFHVLAMKRLFENFGFQRESRFPYLESVVVNADHPANRTVDDGRKVQALRRIRELAREQGMEWQEFRETREKPLAYRERGWMKDFQNQFHIPESQFDL